MGKFYGDIGFGVTEEISDGIWEEHIELRKYYGELTRTLKRLQNEGKVNEDVQLNHQLSFIADAYAFENVNSIKFVNWMGSNWRVSTIEFQRPRIILVLGGGLYQYK